MAKLTPTRDGIPSPVPSPGPGAGAVVAVRYPLIRDGICSALRRIPALGAIGRPEDGEAALDLIWRVRPGIAVLDRDLPGLDMTAIVRATVADGHRTRIIVLASDRAPAPAGAAIEAGAAGYFTMLAPLSDIIDGVHKVMRGETVVGPEFLGELMSRVRSRANHSEPALSAREQEMLHFLTDGRSAPQIAMLLHLSVPTIKTHLTRLYAKLGVSDRAAAVAVGFRRGLIT